MLAHDFLATPRWRVDDEAPDAEAAAAVEAFVAEHGRVGLVCFGSMRARGVGERSDAPFFVDRPAGESPWSSIARSPRANSRSRGPAGSSRSPRSSRRAARRPAIRPGINTHPGPRRRRTRRFCAACGPVIVQKGSTGRPNPPLWDAVAGLPNALLLDADADVTRRCTPHAWLLPKVAWFVCHGGIGTTQAALRARVPTLVVPCVADQRVNADELARRGLSPRVPGVGEATRADLLRGLADLEATRARWAELPAVADADYAAVEAWILGAVARGEPPRLDSYPDTWADLREGMGGGGVFCGAF